MRRVRVGIRSLDGSAVLPAKRRGRSLVVRAGGPTAANDAGADPGR